MTTRSLPGAIALALCPAGCPAILSVRLLPGGEETDHGLGPGGIRRSNSIFRQTSPCWLALAPPCSGEPPPRQPCRVRGGGKVQALSSPSCCCIILDFRRSITSPHLPDVLLDGNPRSLLRGSGRAATQKLSNLIGPIVPQGPWTWQALAPSIA